MTIEQERSKYIKPGFTFIELVVAIAIIGILSVTIGAGLLRYVRKARVTQTQTALQTLKQSVTSYYTEVGKYPNSLTDLIRKPADVAATKWTEPFLEVQEVPKDAYGNDFVYRLTPKGAHAFELYSYGVEGPGSTESIINVWEQ